MTTTQQETSVRRVWYTADVITPNGTDRSVYGEPCEDGQGAKLASGWISPDWSTSQVHDSRDDVAPDTFPDTDPSAVLDDEDDPAAWLAATLAGRLGSVELGSAPSFYAADSQPDYVSGVDVRLAAHVEGFSSDEIEIACHYLATVRG